jgi:hypothetical protein
MRHPAAILLFFLTCTFAYSEYKEEFSKQGDELEEEILNSMQEIDGILAELESALKKPNQPPVDNGSKARDFLQHENKTGTKK